MVTNINNYYNNKTSIQAEVANIEGLQNQVPGSTKVHPQLTQDIKNSEIIIRPDPVAETLVARITELEKKNRGLE